MMNPATPEIYRDVFDRLEHDGVRYVTVGGVAVVLHGHVRSILDLDIVIDPAPEEAARAMRALASSGFVSSLFLPLSMLTVMRMYDVAAREVDVFVRYPIAFYELWANSARVRVGDSMARIASLDHLLRAKRFNARPHDLLDIEALLALEAPDGSRANEGAGGGEE